MPLLTVESPGLLDPVRMVEVLPVWAFETVHRQRLPRIGGGRGGFDGDRDGASDLVQDTMVKAFVRWDRLAGLDRPGAWCHHVLVNACRSRLRRRAIERRYLARLCRASRLRRNLRPADRVLDSGEDTASPSAGRRRAVFRRGPDERGIARVLDVPEGTVPGDLALARRFVMGRLGGRDSDHRDGPSAALEDEFERLGRRAGAELRTPPPPDGHRFVARTSKRRRARIATVATGATVAVVVVGLVMTSTRPPVATGQPPCGDTQSDADLGGGDHWRPGNVAFAGEFSAGVERCQFGDVDWQ